MIDRIFERLTNWLTFSVVFAFIPLLWTIILRYSLNLLSWQNLADSTEIIFFSIYISSSGLGDITHNSMNLQKNFKKAFLLLKYSLILGAIFSALLYGALNFSLIWHSDDFKQFRLNFLTFQIILGISMFITAGISQCLIGIIDNEDKIKV